MEFKSLKNIETSFKQIRFFGIVFICMCAVITCYSLFSAYNFAEKQRQKIYVLDEGKSLMLALSQDMAQNRPVELRQHVRRFHELFFTLAPDRAAIEGNMRRALQLSDRSAFDYYSDMSERGYYNSIISGNINQTIEIDSIVTNTNTYPYNAVTYARQFVIRESNLTERSLITRCNVINSVRSDNNPHGFTIEAFEVIENRNIRVINR